MNLVEINDNDDKFSDTIAAICTPVGIGSVCGIRISGKKCFEITKRVFVPKDGCDIQELSGYNAKLGYISNSEKIYDECIIIIYKAPKSYTGENVIEFFCHGGYISCRQILKLILENGAVLAKPGEFTKRAFLNGKITLDKAEGLEAFISSEHSHYKDLSFSSFIGETGRKIEEIRLKTLNILAEVNVRIDYPEDDFENLSLEKTINDLNKVSEELKKFKDTYKTGKVIKDGVQIALIGLPNTGKSSLMNVLAKREKSIVTDIAGTTRDAIEEKIVLGDILINLIDTAGIRETKELIEKIGTEKSIQIAKNVDIIFMLFDSTLEIKAEEINILKQNSNKKIVAVMNKIDISNEKILNLNENKIKKYVSAIVKISAKENIGIYKIEEALIKILDFSLDKDDLVLINERQFEIVNTAFKNFKEAIDAAKIGYDALSFVLEETVKKLDEFYGHNINEKIVDEIFSKFCLGK